MFNQCWYFIGSISDQCNIASILSPAANKQAVIFPYLLTVTCSRQSDFHQLSSYQAIEIGCKTTEIGRAAYLFSWLRLSPKITNMSSMVFLLGRGQKCFQFLNYQMKCLYCIVKLHKNISLSVIKHMIKKMHMVV